MISFPLWRHELAGHLARGDGPHGGSTVLHLPLSSMSHVSFSGSPPPPARPCGGLWEAFQVPPSRPPRDLLLFPLVVAVLLRILPGPRPVAVGRTGESRGSGCRGGGRAGHDILPQPPVPREIGDSVVDRIPMLLWRMGNTCLSHSGKGGGPVRRCGAVGRD